MTNRERRTLDRGALVTGLVLIAYGVMFLLEAVGVYDLEPGQLWAILLIGLGVAVLFGGRGPDPEA